jgi:glucosamine-6-phosphate deaminase
MELMACNSPEAITSEAHRWCESRIGSDSDAGAIFLPAGSTPIPLYRLWESNRPAYLKNRRLLQIDDVLTGRHRFMFRRFFETNLSSYIDQFVPIESGNDMAQLAILGFGLNGHVAFHEPGLPAEFYSGCVRLSSESRATLKLEDGAWGVTYGLGAFLATKSVLMMVSGAKKKKMFRRFMAEADTFPATFLKRHRDLTVVTDFDWR